MRFRLATWNINSVRLRLDLVERFTRAHQPDILCLQEIKCVDGLFPELPLRALGFDHVAVAGQKGYHGVAVLSRIPFTKVQRRDICGRGHARHLSVTLDCGASQAKPLALHNIYVPAGGDLPDPSLNPKFRHKLDFLEAMEAWFAGLRGKRGNRMILVGDLRRAARDRRVVAQAAPESGEPHARRGRALPAGASRPRLGRRDAPACACGGEALHLVELPQSRLARVKSRPPPRSIWTTPALDGAATSMRVLDEARDGRAPRTTFRLSPISRLSESPSLPARR